MRFSDTDGGANDERHPTQYRRTDVRADVIRGQINVIELPHGDTLDTVLNLGEEEQTHESIAL